MRNMCDGRNSLWVLLAVIGMTVAGMGGRSTLALEPLTMIKDINQGEVPPPTFWLAEMGGNLYFANGTPGYGVELWKSDGTPGGTAMVLDINPSSSSSLPSDLKVMGSKLYFSAGEEAHGQEIWVSDGTGAGTQLLKDIVPGLSSSSPRGFALLGSTLFFLVPRHT